MSKETLRHLNANTLIGYTAKRGTAWHYRAGLQQGAPNHYAGPIPIEDVHSRLFDWTAIEAPVTAMVGDVGIPVPGRKAIVRSDDLAVVGVVGSGYKVHPYEEWLVRNVATILDADVAVGSAGLLRGGALAWVQVELEDTVDVEGVAYRPFLTAATSLDGSMATTYQTGAQVVVCDNTLSVALASPDTAFKIRHSRHSLGKVNEARKALDIVHRSSDQFAAQVQTLCDQTITDSHWERFLHETFPGASSTNKAARARAEHTMTQIDTMYRTDARACPWTGTAWGVLATMNTWHHHTQETRGEGTRLDRNMMRAVTGAIDTMDRAVLDRLALAA